MRYTSSLTIGHTIRLQGIGRIILGEGVQLGYDWANGQGQPIVLQPRTSEAHISIGAGSAIMNGSCLIACAAINIGNDVAIGAETLILDSDFHGLHPNQRKEQGAVRPITIEDNVFIGTRVTILKGVTIGKNSVIGAGSVVASNVPPNSIAAGNPAKVIRLMDNI